MILYILCHNSTYGYFEDYILSLENILKYQFSITKILYNQPSELECIINDNDRYLFFQVIPEILKTTLMYPHCAVVNTEQLTRPEWLSSIRTYLESGIAVYDYDLYQSRMLGHPQHQYLPYPITLTEYESLSQLLKQTPKIYDIAFCGALSPRREHILKTLRDLGVSIINVHGHGLVRDKLIAQARVLLNIHYNDDYQIFEHLRCDRWIITGMLVISERSVSDVDFNLKKMVIRCDYNQLGSKVMETLHNYPEKYLKHLKKLETNGEKAIQVISNQYHNFLL